MTHNAAVLGTPTKNRPAVVAGVIAVIVLLIVVIFAASSFALEASRRMRCQSNMQQIAAAIAKNGGVTGTEIGALIDSLVRRGLLAKEQLICPSSGLVEPNYIYIPSHTGPGKTARVDNTAVVLFEPKANHAGKGGNVLFADGHATFLIGAEYDEMLQTLAQLPKVNIGD